MFERHWGTPGFTPYQLSPHPLYGLRTPALRWLSYVGMNQSAVSTATVPVILTNLLTSWCRVLLEKLTGLQLVKKFPAFHGTRRFITALTSVRHLSLSWTSPIQSIYPHPTSWRSIQILPTHLRLGLPSGLFPSGFPTKTLYTPLSSPIRATCPAVILKTINFFFFFKTKIFYYFTYWWQVSLFRPSSGNLYVKFKTLYV